MVGYFSLCVSIFSYVIAIYCRVVTLSAELAYVSWVSCFIVSPILSLWLVVFLVLAVVALLIVIVVLVVLILSTLLYGLGVL